MSEYEEKKQQEIVYLEKISNFIKNELDKENETLIGRRSNLIASRRDMWEETVHFTNDFERLTEINQHLSEVNSQTISYDSTLKLIEKYKRMLKSPYFGRFDFIEDNSNEREKIYIGLNNLIDSKNYNVLVYDWRAPISSIFYRFELGRASYNAPIGDIPGEVLLKRQYKIENSKLKYFFDCNIRISDEILQEVLGHNTSSKMKNIVETIQREQDIIIRDTDNDLLIVQGVAGSGKTSIALHRIAFLLYEGMNSKISSNNIIIISPNSVFSSYISSVLPELGEENVKEITFENIAYKLFEGRVAIENRNMQLESLILSHGKEELIRRQSIEFKGSKTFMIIIDRLLQYYERHMIPFEDVYFKGRIIENRQELKNFFLNNKIGMPMARRLKRIENMMLEKTHYLQNERLREIEKIVEDNEGHEFEIKSFSRLLSIKKTKIFVDNLHRFTEVDYYNIYKILFNDSQLFFKLADGLELPKDIDEIISRTKEKIEKGFIDYEDCAPLLYLKIIIEGCDLFSEIRQVVIDEAQDYYPMQYEVFKLLFNDARYTVLGDINQGLEKYADKSIYDDITEIMDKRKTVKLFLNKSYRSSYEINLFTQKLLNRKMDFVPFERHESEPIVVFEENQELIDKKVANDIDNYLNNGYGSIAVICKTRHQAKAAYGRLKKLTNVKLISKDDEEIQRGALVIPSYMTKGLEFDVVIVYDASENNYTNDFDRRLLYVSCTRALHQLVIYYTGEKSSILSI